LGIAYEATLHGWVRALDLRDKETEGHTQRVTLLTQRLAQKMGFERESLEHIKRGALLHDIGKMAISDEILRKNGPLTPEERAIMQKHPVHAYEMLSPIEFLRPAIDIPYRHHEKWDGSGYPHGLKGEEIPFAARIFSVIDVWDALTSKRPYHEARSHEEVRQLIQADAGKHFDPHVVEAFMDLKDLSV
jgi:putative nucleotidyltransferase with HDIG domain